MKETAVISLILPVQKEDNALDLVREYRMYCNRKTLVIPAPGKPAKRVLLEFSFNPGKEKEEDLTIETGGRHVYSNQFKALTGEFYLD